jgi:regulator of sirC expression with transglutaminase-like and TPR domain
MNSNFGWQQFAREIARADGEIDLAKASLYYAQAEYTDLDPEEYLEILDIMGKELLEKLPDNRYPLKVIQTINQYLFEELEFQGNTKDYYDRRNSFINETIDRRQGIPITLSVIYLEVAKRINFPMVGIGMPGHFLIRPDFEGVGIYVDPFNRGEILFEEDCQARLREVYQQPLNLESRHLEPVTNKQILARMLTNLKFIYIQSQHFNKALEIIEGILMLFPENPKEMRDSGLLYYQIGNISKAYRNLEFYLDTCPNAEDAYIIRQLLEKMT